MTKAAPRLPDVDGCTHTSTPQSRWKLVALIMANVRNEHYVFCVTCSRANDCVCLSYPWNLIQTRFLSGMLLKARVYMIASKLPGYKPRAMLSFFCTRSANSSLRAATEIDESSDVCCSWSLYGAMKLNCLHTQ